MKLFKLWKVYAVYTCVVLIKDALRSPKKIWYLFETTYFCTLKQILFDFWLRGDSVL